MTLVYVLSILGVIVWSALSWLLAAHLHLVGSRFWVLWGGLTILGVLAAVAVIWWQRAKRKAAAAAAGAETTDGDHEVELLIRDAERKLAAARLPAGTKIGNLPVIILLGDPNTTKSSTMVHSGLEPELLAGQVYQNSNIVPTRSANLWFAKQAVFVEAGGKLLPDNTAWTRLVRRLRPGKLGSVVGKSEQAPRAALVCFDCESFTRQGAAEAVAASSRNLHARLSEISQLLGISFPVYVLFTKADRLPFFADFVRNLSNEESTQVVGATLPMRPERSGGVYGEEETARLTGSFENLFRSLCDARPELLSRESDPTKLPGTYEFPREFRKLRALAVQFLVDLCRPSQLTVGPFLRGFYFSGVRPIIVNEMAPAPAARPAERAGLEGASGATGMFNLAQRAQQQAAQAPPQVVGSRKVPQWLFLSHLFNGVILQDRAALGASGASTKTNFWRRMLLAFAAVVCLVFAVGFTVSYFQNRALETQALDAARGISASESTGQNLASVDALRRLETLRQSLETLTTYERDGAPWSYRWFLFSGSRIYPDVNKLYFNRFHQLLFAQTQANLLSTLQQLPSSPGPKDEYGPAYDALKAYLITTSNHDKSTKLFLSPVLLTHWEAGRDVDPERVQLAQKQFDFYSEELKYENPFSSENDTLAVSRARHYLAQFAGTERVYQNMLAEAAKNNPSLNFNQHFPGSAEAVIDNRDVAGAFTKGGWNFMKDALKNVDRYFSGERWVLGDQTTANFDRSKVEQEIRDRYYSDFINQWRAYLNSARVARYASLQDAAKKLNKLSGNQSPLLQLFWLASQNTNVDDPKVADAFQPVHAVMPPASINQYIAPPNQNYMNSLLTLQASLDQIANQPGQVNDAAAAQTLANANNAKVITKQVAQAFRPDREGHVDSTVEKLMEDPITNVEGLLRNLGPAELNGDGKSFCGQLRPLLAKYPFNPSATAQATLDEVNAMFGKPDGALWAFYNKSLQKVLQKQGSQ